MAGGETVCSVCPHCGFDLDLDQPLSSGGLTVDPRGGATWRGAPIHLDPSKTIIMHTLLKERGRIVPLPVLAERIGYDGDRLHNIVNVHLCRLRKMLAGAPIETVRSAGVRWAA